MTGLLKAISVVLLYLSILVLVVGVVTLGLWLSFGIVLEV